MKLVGESLQLGFPHTRAVPVAAAGIGSDEELASPRIARRPIRNHHVLIAATANNGVS
jgi:hypothetical protein